MRWRGSPGGGGVVGAASATLLELVGEFDATNALRLWTEVKSVAHWLAWSCSMTLPTAREHVRVAKALRRMPTVAAAFAAGRLSNSKVGEVTRVVDVVDEAQLCTGVDRDRRPAGGDDLRVPYR